MKAYRLTKHPSSPPDFPMAPELPGVALTAPDTGGSWSLHSWQYSKEMDCVLVVWQRETVIDPWAET